MSKLIYYISDLAKTVNTITNITYAQRKLLLLQDTTFKLLNNISVNWYLVRYANNNTFTNRVLNRPFMRTHRQINNNRFDICMSLLLFLISNTDLKYRLNFNNVCPILET